MIIIVVIALIVATLPSGRTETFDYPFKTMNDCQEFLAKAMPDMKTEHPKVGLSGSCTAVEIELVKDAGRGI